MTRNKLLLLLALTAAVPAAAASAFFGPPPQPCFVEGNAGYRFTAAPAADYTIRVGGETARPDLRLQLVSDAAQADFVLVDDGDGAPACHGAGAKSIRVDAAAANPDVIVDLSKQPAEGAYKIFVRSASVTEQDAAALFAVIWKTSHGREFVARR